MADINYRTNRPDSPAVGLTKNLRDRLDGSFAETVNAEPNYSYSRQSTLSSPAIKAGPGVLHSISIGNIGTAATLIVYDNTSASGTILFNLTTSPTVPVTFILDAQFATGLSVTLGGTAAMDVTLTYR